MTIHTPLSQGHEYSGHGLSRFGFRTGGKLLVCGGDGLIKQFISEQKWYFSII